MSCRHRFMKIRYFGFLANSCKSKAILWIRRLMGIAIVILAFAKETIREKMYRLTGSDILRCPIVAREQRFFMLDCR